jgi:hypothetical protein
MLQIFSVELAPLFPVNALALPALTTIALADPLAARFSLHNSTGAEAVFDVVKHPATFAPTDITASIKSARS